MRLVRVLALLSFVGVLASSALADKYESNEKNWSNGVIPSTAVYPEDEGVNNTCPGQAIACGDDVQPAAINPAGEVDWLQFYATAGTLITVGTDAWNGSTTDTYLELYFGCGTGIIASDDDSGPGFFSLISNFPAPTTGYYQIKVRGYNGSSQGEYKLFLRCTEPTPPPENDRCNDQYAIERCSQGSLEGDLQWATDNYHTNGSNPCTGYSADGKDVAYRLDLNAGDVVDLTYTQPTFDASFYIITDCANSAGTCVVGADDTVTGEPEVIHYVVPTTGTYWLILDTYGTNTGGVWTLTYNITCAGPSGACCIGSVCRITSEQDCPGTWYGEGSSCDPNPCPTPAVETSWGQIKADYR